MKFRFLLWALAVCLWASAARGQTALVSGEYFFGVDSGFGAGIPFTFTANDTLDTSVSIQIPDSMPAGLYTVYLRVKDDSGRWSHTQSQLITVTQTQDVDLNALATAEYFWDTDPGFGQGIPVAVPADSMVDFPAQVFVPDSFQMGLHSLYFRIRDLNGRWSHTVKQNISLEPPAQIPADITLFEYAIYDLASGATLIRDSINAATPGQDVNQDLSIALPGPPIQDATSYCLGITAIDARGKRGLEYSRTIRICNAGTTPAGAAFTYQSQVGVDTVSFTSTSTGTGLSYEWHYTTDSTDTLFATTANPQYTFPGPGTYSVTLIVSNGCNQDTLTDSVVIDTPVWTKMPLGSVASISLYPNPAGSILTVSLGTNTAQTLRVEVLDIQGRTVPSFTQNINLLPGTNRFRVNTQALPQGVYILRLRNGNEVLQKRFAHQ